MSDCPDLLYNPEQLLVGVVLCCRPVASSTQTQSLFSENGAFQNFFRLQMFRNCLSTCGQRKRFLSRDVRVCLLVVSVMADVVEHRGTAASECPAEVAAAIIQQPV